MARIEEAHLQASRGFWGMIRWLMVLLLLTAAPALGRDTAPASGALQGQLAKRFIIVASHPDASAAGHEMLKRGGSAVDAAIAAQAVMGLVEPQSSGLGGGAFILTWTKRSGAIQTYDGRETAPKSATPSLFLTPDGKPLDFISAVVGGKSVGVPGVVAAMALAHREHGKLAWAELFQPAIRLADQGFKVSPRLAKLVARDPLLLRIPETAAYFYPGGKPLSEGQIAKNPAYAATLRVIAERGERAFYTGAIAEAIVKAVQGSPVQPGTLSLRDMASYRPVKREPVCRRYRDHRICSMGPPSSGAVAMLQILGLLERFEISAMGPLSAAFVHHFGEAGRLAFADRDYYLGDPAFVRVPVKALIAAPYLRERSALIDAAKAMEKPEPGRLAGNPPAQRRAGLDYSRPSTAHLSVIDGQGNAVAMTTTVEGGFGSHLMAAGFVLNNQLTDFVFEPETDGKPNANAPAGGKRPLSSMTPAFIFDPKGQLMAVIGSPGGWRIIPYVTQTVIGLIDFKLPLKDAIAMPHISARRGLDLEDGVGAFDALVPELEKLGHKVRRLDMQSGLNGIRITPEGYEGAPDPRREGQAWGE